MFAGLVTLAAFWSLISIPFDGAGWVDKANDVFTFVGIPASPSLFLAGALAILGGALRRRLAIARRVVLVFEWLSLVAFVVAWIAVVLSETGDLTGGDAVDLDTWSAVVLGAGTLAALILVVLFTRARAQFPARTRPGAWRTALVVLVLGLAVATVVVAVIAFIVPGTLEGPGETLVWAVQATTEVTLPIDPLPAGHDGPAWLAVLGGLLAGGVLLGAVATYLGSVHRAELMTAPDELAVRALVAAHGEADSLSYFATRRDKSVVFSTDGQAAVTYRVIGSVCLASGDPVGDPASWPAAINSWLGQARGFAFHPAVIGASESGAEAYVAAGLRARELGDEAVLIVEDFALAGRAMRPVKRAVSRVAGQGYTISVIRHGDLSAAELTELGALADGWRGDEPDRGFSMALNRLGDRADGSSVAVIARNRDGHITAIQSYVPWGRRGLSLDLMRRDPQAANGVNEALVVGLVEACPDLGVRQISLNFAMFRSVFAGADRVGAGIGVRLADRVLTLADRFWQLDSLYRANAKYLPEWRPRYLCFDSVAALPQVGLAMGVAEGFLPGRAPTVARTGEELIPDGEGAPRPFAEVAIEQELRLSAPAVVDRRRPQQELVRLRKAERLREAGIEPYPVQVARTGSLGAAASAARSGATDPMSVTGRVRAVRDFGGVLFAVLEEDGHVLQALLSRADVADQGMPLWRRSVDLGDIVSVTGPLGRSRRGEPSVLVTTWAMAAKCLRPLPGVRAGFTDPEARVRQRAVDLIVNRSSVEMLQARSRGIAAMRAAFAARGFLEVETPMLQAVHGGATARPFRTHINAYDADLYLRIAPELFLKHLCVGGMARIFELNRNFRNEGADATHNPEFTSVEAYAAYEDYTSMRHLTRDLILAVATAVHGEPIALQPGPDGSVERVRLDGEWPVISVHEAVSRACGVTLTSAASIEQVRVVADTHGIHLPAGMTSGEAVLELYDELVEGQTRFPTFYTDFPLETSPLTRTHRTDPRLSERWDLVAFGAEIGTAYSELIDPLDQRARLVAQSLKAAAGDPEAMEVDENFLAALEYAMPPTGGLGIGVDRMIMMLTGANIRATLAFPFVRPGDER